MNHSLFVDVGIPTILLAIAEIFYFFGDRPTGIFRDPTGRFIIHLRLFKGRVTRDGVTTDYHRYATGSTTTLKRPGVKLVLTHQKDGTISDATGTRFTAASD